MEPKTKKRIIIASASLVILGVGGYFLYKWWKKKKDEEEAKKQEEAAKLSQSSTPSTPSYTPTGPTYPATGLSQKDGDNFRKWMNEKQPTWKSSKGDKVDATGKPDTTTLREAWFTFKDAYTKDQTVVTPKPEVTGDYKVNDIVIAKADVKLYPGETLVNPYPYGGSNSKGVIQKGYYVGVVKEINTKRGAVKVENHTYNAVDKNEEQVKVFWVEGKNIEKK